jgi:hypothetical protein
MDEQTLLYQFIKVKLLLFDLLKEHDIPLNDGIEMKILREKR